MFMSRDMPQCHWEWIYVIGLAGRSYPYDIPIVGPISILNSKTTHKTIIIFYDIYIYNIYIYPLTYILYLIIHIYYIYNIYIYIYLFTFICLISFRLQSPESYTNQMQELTRQANLSVS